MTDAPSPRLRRSLSPEARSLRLQRIFARLQDGASYADIAAEEGFSRERLRQIIRAATAPGRGYDGPDHERMQVARLTPALRLAAEASLVARPNPSRCCCRSSIGSTAIPIRSRISAPPSCSWKGDARHPRGAENRQERKPAATPPADPPRRVPKAHRRASMGLKTLKTARASYWLKSAFPWDRRHVRSGSAPF
jgi:hypothetical protein